MDLTDSGNKLYQFFRFKEASPNVFMEYFEKLNIDDKILRKHV